MRRHEGSNLVLLGVFFGLLLPSVFLHHVSTGLLVVASPWRPILVLQKSSFPSCLHVFYGPAKNKVRERFFCRLPGLPAFASSHVG